MAQNKPKDPTRVVTILIIVCVLIVLGTVLYNAIIGRRAFEAEMAAGNAPAVASAPALASGASGY